MPWRCCGWWNTPGLFLCAGNTEEIASKWTILICSCCFLGDCPSILEDPSLLSQAALGISSAQKWSILTHLGKKKIKKTPTSFAPARLKIGAVSSLGKGNSQLPTEDWTAPGCSAAGYPEVLPQFPVPGCTGSLLGRGDGAKEGLLL